MANISDIQGTSKLAKALDSGFCRAVCPAEPIWRTFLAVGRTLTYDYDCSIPHLCRFGRQFSAGNTDTGRCVYAGGHDGGAEANSGDGGAVCAGGDSAG